MKVCFISGEYPPLIGGVGDYTHIMAHTLPQMGVQTAVLTTSNARTSGGPGPDDVPVWPIVRHWGFTSWPAIGRTLDHLAADLAHLQYQTAAYAMHPAVNLLPWWLRQRFPHLSTVTTFHDLREPYLFPKAGNLRGWANRFLLKQSHAVVLTNVEDASRARQWGIDFSGSRPLVRLIPIGANVLPSLPNDYDRQMWRRRCGVQGDGYLISHFGLINHSKGFDTLLHALRRLVDAGVLAHLVVVGGGTGESDPTNRVYRQQMLQLAEQLSLHHHTHWTGFLPQEEASACFKASDVCVLPYRDGASYRRGSLMAALAHGLPIVSTQNREGLGPPLPAELGSPPELIGGQNCLLVPPDDPVALSGAIRQVLCHPDLAQRLGAAAMELSSAFSWRSIAEKHLALYEELLHQRGAGD